MKRKLGKAKHAAEPSGDEPKQSQDAAGQTGEFATAPGEPLTADRPVLNCRGAELAFDGQRVELAVPGAGHQSLPIGWCVRVAVRPLPGARTLQFVLHFALGAPSAPDAGSAKESPVLIVLRLFVDEPYLHDAEMMAERLSRCVPRPAPTEARPTVWYATRNEEWAFFSPMTGTVEVRDGLAGWARNRGSGHAASP
ncbi:hypothetical protein [Actinomadura sp. 3N508]|uniref:hypothetical protein n=1 Tax=Actinomadura sp. 3N508 TaxID=3375153 RepID=UPI0037AFAE76